MKSLKRGLGQRPGISPRGHLKSPGPNSETSLGPNMVLSQSNQYIFRFKHG